MAEKLYEVTLIGTYNGQEHVNRFNYQAVGASFPTGTAFALVQAIGLDGSGGTLPSGLGNAIVGMVRPELTFNQCLARAVYDPTDFVDVPFVPVVPGAQSITKALSNTASYGFYTNRKRADIGRGTKRYAGVEDDFVANINQITAPGLVAMNNVATGMSEVVTASVAGVTINFHPCVVKKFKYTTPSGRKAYRYYTTAEGGEAAQMANLAVDVVWSPYTTLRNQESRQTGKGR